MATIVTGGTGFVGSNIVKELGQRGHEVISIDVVEPDEVVRRFLEPWSDLITWIKGDILDRDALHQVASGRNIQKLVHAAVYTAVSEDIEKANSRKIVDINLVGTANLLDLAKELSLERMVYVSSGGVYEGIQPSDNPLREDVPAQPIQLYNIAKYASELLTLRYGELHGIGAVCVRLGGPYGPMERINSHRSIMSMMHELTGKVVRGEPIELVAGEYRDFTYVSDIAAGIYAVLDAAVLPHRLFNLSRGIPVSSDELLSALRRFHDEVEIIEQPLDETVMTQESPRRRLMDTSRIQEDLGFYAQYDLESGLRDYIDWRYAYNYTG